MYYIDKTPVKNFRSCIVLALLAFATTAVAHDVQHDAVADDHRHAFDHADSRHTADVRSLARAFRRTGDDAYLDTAWLIVTAHLDSGPRHVDDLIDAAVVAQARHRFDDALGFIDEALSIRPTSDQAWLLRSSVLLVLGNTGDSAAACRELRDTAPIIVAACHARAATHSSNADAAAHRLDAMLRVTDNRLISAPILGWILSVAADLDAATGQLDRAEQRYRDSLAIAENVQVRAALADLLIDAARNDEAAQVIDAGAPALPLVVRRMIVAKRTGNGHLYSEQVAHANHEFQGWIAEQDWLHAREMSRFYIDVIDRPTLARQLAKINLTMQREREDLKLAARTGADAL